MRVCPQKLATFGLINLSALLLSAPALAQLTLPKLEAGQHVYTIPPDFDPPLIGKAGLQEIEAAADQLHYPYYVVLVQDLAGGSDQAAASLIHNYAQEWTSRFPGVYDPQTSQVFVLTYNPRKFRFLAGARFKDELGFEREAHQPYTDIFVKSVSGAPKDPKSGIIKMMQAVDTYLYDKTDPARVAKHKLVDLILKLLLGLLLLGVVALFRFFQLRGSRKAFEAQWEKWNKKLQNAYQQFTSFDAETRESLLSLKDMEGETRQLYEKVTAEVDEITLSLGALQAHLDACKAQADKATILNVGAVKQAQEALNQPFDFDTRQANRQELFGAPTVVLNLKVQDFIDKMQGRYARAKKGWNRLKAAAEAAWQPPQEALPPALAARFEAVPAQLRVGLEHPLLPQSKAEALYQELEALRWKDALVYAGRIEQVRQAHDKLLERIAPVEADLQAIAAAEDLKAQTYSQLVLGPDDRPEALLERAHRFHADLKQALDASLGFEQLKAQATRTLEAYRAFEALEAEIGAALSGLPDKLRQLEATIGELESLRGEVGEEAKRASRYHRQADFGKDLAEAGEDLKQAGTELESVRQLETEHRSLDAWRQALRLEARLTGVREELGTIRSLCEEMANQKAQYEETLRHMQEEARDYNQRMSNYGHSTVFVVPAYEPGLVYDYSVLLSDAQSQRQHWSSSVSEAQAAYQAEIDRQAASSSSSSSSSWSSCSSSSSSCSSSGGSSCSSSSSSCSSSGGSW